jgi:hypothetical protein
MALRRSENGVTDRQEGSGSMRKSTLEASKKEL